MGLKSKKPTDMSTLFQTTTGTLAQIAKKTNSLAQLADIVRQTCPDLPEEVWQIANFHQNKLVIEVNSAIWAQRLQFERYKICQQLALATDNLFNHIEIKVSPYRNKKSQIDQRPNTDKKKHAISQSTATHLNEIAENAPKGLKEKLQKLARLADNSSNTK